MDQIIVKVPKLTLSYILRTSNSITNLTLMSQQ